jgi:Cu-processing system ATP-binding protein
MPQIGRYPDNMSIGSLLSMMKDIRNHQGVLDEELIFSLGISSMLHKKMRTLSGGTRQKVSAVLAFLFNPEILILDEPTAGLDPVSTEILKTKINSEKTKGKLILITSHVLSELDDLVTQVVFLQDGKLVFHQSIQDLQMLTGEIKLNKAIAKIMQQQAAV